MDFVGCYAAFSEIKEKILKDSRPILIEVITERFKGHSISDPGLYRSKDELQAVMKNDPIVHLKELLEKEQWLTEESYKKMEKEAKEKVLEAISFAESSEWPDPLTLEEGVFKDG